MYLFICLFSECPLEYKLPKGRNLSILFPAVSQSLEEYLAIWHTDVAQEIFVEWIYEHIKSLIKPLKYYSYITMYEIACNMLTEKARHT